MSQKNRSEPKTELPTVDSIIDEIAKKTADGDYIFRGESQCHEKITSGLYRKLEKLRMLNLGVETAQKEELKRAKEYEYTKKTDEFEILTDIQHFGGKTNLLDFTTDYRIALFFACASSPFKDGRIILLDKTGTMKAWIRKPGNSDPESRVRVQKSIFVMPPTGTIEPDEKVDIPKDLKKPMLKYLEKEFDIPRKTIYPDLYGFVSSQETRWNIYEETGKGNDRLKSAEEAESSQEKSKNYQKAVQHFTSAIDNAIQLDEGFALACKGRGCAYFAKYNLDNSTSDLENAIADFSEAIKLMPEFAEVYNRRGGAYLAKGIFEPAVTDFRKAIELEPNYAEAYYNLGVGYFFQCKLDEAIQEYSRAILLKSDNITYYDRGVAWLHLQEWEKARTDLIYAESVGVDSIALFHNFCGSIKNYEDKIGTKLPQDIAAMLTQS